MFRIHTPSLEIEIMEKEMEIGNWTFLWCMERKDHICIWRGFGISKGSGEIQNEVRSLARGGMRRRYDN